MTLRLNESGDLVRLEPVKVAQFMGHSHDAKLLATAAELREAGLVQVGDGDVVVAKAYLNLLRSNQRTPEQSWA